MYLSVLDRTGLMSLPEKKDENPNSTEHRKNVSSTSVTRFARGRETHILTHLCAPRPHFSIQKKTRKENPSKNLSNSRGKKKNKIRKIRRTCRAHFGS